MDLTKVSLPPDLSLGRALPSDRIAKGMSRHFGNLNPYLANPNNGVSLLDSARAAGLFVRMRLAFENHSSAHNLLYLEMQRFDFWGVKPDGFD